MTFLSILRILPKPFIACSRWAWYNWVGKMRSRLFVIGHTKIHQNFGGCFYDSRAAQQG